jgi:hypothetical protein
VNFDLMVVLASRAFQQLKRSLLSHERVVAADLHSRVIHLRPLVQRRQVDGNIVGVELQTFQFGQFRINPDRTLLAEPSLAAVQADLEPMEFAVAWKSELHRLAAG